jgi:hypothetical protein
VYECPRCGYTLEVFVPVIEALCPNEHTVKTGSKRRTGRVPMSIIYDRRNNGNG